MQRQVPSTTQRVRPVGRRAAELRVVCVPTRELAAFAEDAARHARPDQALPIPPARARAQALNPDADPQDVALVAGYLDDQCVSSIGLLLGRLRIGVRLKKIRWATAWWASDAHRGRGFGRALLEAALTEPHDFLSAGNSEAAERSFRRYGCSTLPGLEWDTIAASPPLRRRVLAGLRRRLGLPAVQGAAPPAAMRMPRAGDAGHVELRRVEALGARAAEFLWAHTPPVGFYRSADVINWMVSHPWVRERPEDAALNYYFARAASLFRYAIYEAYDAALGDYVGFVVFKLTGEPAGLAVQLLDYCFDREADELAAEAVLAFGRAVGALALRVPWYVSQHAINQLPSGARSRRRVRKCFWWPGAAGSPLREVADQLRLRHVDGDMPFI